MMDEVIAYRMHYHFNQDHDKTKCGENTQHRSDRHSRRVHVVIIIVCDLQQGTANENEEKEASGDVS